MSDPDAKALAMSIARVIAGKDANTAICALALVINGCIAHFPPDRRDEVIMAAIAALAGVEEIAQ